jgi:hypothetical protein
LYFSAKRSPRCPAILFKKTVAVIIFATYMCLGLVDIGQKGLEENITGGSVIITIHGTVSVASVHN